MQVVVVQCQSSTLRAKSEKMLNFLYVIYLSLRDFGFMWLFQDPTFMSVAINSGLRSSYSICSSRSQSIWLCDPWRRYAIVGQQIESSTDVHFRTCHGSAGTQQQFLPCSEPLCPNELIHVRSISRDLLERADLLYFYSPAVFFHLWRNYFMTMSWWTCDIDTDWVAMPCSDVLVRWYSAVISSLFGATNPKSTVNPPMPWSWSVSTPDRSVLMRCPQIHVWSRSGGRFHRSNVSSALVSCLSSKMTNNNRTSLLRPGRSCCS